MGFLMILLKTKLFTGHLIVFERYFIALFFGFILLDQIHLKYSLFKIGRIKLFNHLGKISYGLYMYHLVVLFVLKDLMSKSFPNTIDNYYLTTVTYLLLSLTITYIISILSYKLIEKPFLKLKKKFI